MFKRILKYTILFAGISFATNYYQNKIAPNQNYQATSESTTQQQSAPRYRNDQHSQEVKLPSINENGTTNPNSESKTNALPIPNKTDVPLEGYRWLTNDITIAINTDDQNVKKAFENAIDAWNETGAVHFKTVNIDQNPGIVCSVQDLSSKTTNTPTSTTKELGETQCQYDPDKNQIVHATSNLDANALADSTDEYRAKVAMHELGHAIGLDHAQEGSDSVMVPYNVKTSITQRDINSVKALYQE